MTKKKPKLPKPKSFIQLKVTPSRNVGPTFELGQESIWGGALRFNARKHYPNLAKFMWIYLALSRFWYLSLNE